MTRSAKVLLVLTALLACWRVNAGEIVVIGKLITNEPINYVHEKCPDDEICMHSWWAAVIQVERTLKGSPLSGRITAAVWQHVGMNEKYQQAVRYFVLEAIEDPALREKLHAEYQLTQESIGPPRRKR